jgi:pimeloyl-ACP methyl ester carboxylesterase
MLVGHSFGGLAINGVMDAIPDRVRHLVYLDSLMVEGARARSTSCRRYLRRATQGRRGNQ